MPAILRAFLTTACGLAAYAALHAVGAAADSSLFGGLALAGALNIAGLASLNATPFLPTSEPAAGEG